MALFHATLNDYSPGQTVTAAAQTSFYPLAVSALDQARPLGLPSRAICFFATDELEFAYLFALKQQWHRDQIRLYEVSMDIFHKAPMAIVHATQRRLEKSENVAALVSEYWSPKLTWHYFEYFGPQMTIIERISAPTFNEVVMGLNYQSEADVAARLQLKEKGLSSDFSR